MRPALEPDVSLAVVAAIAVLNPAVILLGAWLGARCSEAGKLPVAGFMAGLAGMALVWIAAWLRLPYAVDAARAAGGIFAIQLVFGTVWAALAYWLARKQR